MLSSVAERVYWLGRYLERVENTARLLNVYSAMLFDLPRGTPLGWNTLIDITGSNDDYAAFSGRLEERAIIRFLIAEKDNPASIFSALSMARENARTCREVIPSEGWEQINDLYLYTRENLASSLSRGRRHELLNAVINHCQQISGMMSGAMSHNTAYSFIHLGRKLERADMTTRIVDVGSISLLPGLSGKQQQALLESYESLVWMNILRCLSAYQAYRQQVHNRVNGDEVVRFLLQDEAFPRSINFCLSQLSYFVQKLPRNDNVLRAVARVQRICKEISVSRLLEKGLLDFIDELQISIADIHEEINETWFRPAVSEVQEQEQFQ